jgi:hypothetical protein
LAAVEEAVCCEGIWTWHMLWRISAYEGHLRLFWWVYTLGYTANETKAAVGAGTESRCFYFNS